MSVTDGDGNTSVKEIISSAVLQMQLLGHSFYMFLNAETNDINVVYSRDDGGYGVLVPDK